MTKLVRLPSTREIAAVADPSARLVALVEPATALLARASTVDLADEIRSQAVALESYAKAKRLATEAVGAAQTIARRAEMRMGELEPKRLTSPKRTSSQRGLSADPQPRRAENRKLADHREEVERMLEREAPKGRATRRRALSAATTAKTAEQRAKRNREAAEMAVAGNSLAAIALHFGVNDTRTIRRWIMDAKGVVEKKQHRKQEIADPAKTVIRHMRQAHDELELARQHTVRANPTRKDLAGAEQLAGMMRDALDEILIAMNPEYAESVADAAEDYLRGK